MSTPGVVFRGGCLCGAIRYEITAEPLFGGHCQCRDCQHESGGGHTSFMAFPSDAVKLTGTPRFYESKADSGNTMGRGFCPDLWLTGDGLYERLAGGHDDQRRQPR